MMIARVVAVATGLVTALIASQAPEFAQQYRQRLGGAIDELRLIVNRFDADAAAVGRSRAAMIERLRADSDEGVRRQGASIESTTARLDNLERQRREAAEAGPFGRIVAVAKGADASIASAAYLDFEPAVPVTQEGVVAAGLGFVAGWAGLHLFARILRRLAGGRNRDRLRSA